MKLTIKNVGKIKEATIDLDNQLTVFFGGNNTGKTYVSYCIYGLGTLSRNYSTRNELVNEFKDFQLNEINSSGAYEWNLLDLLMPQRVKFKSFFESSICKYLPIVFGANNPSLSNAKIGINVFENDDFFKKFIIEQEFGLGGILYKPYTAFFNKEKEVLKANVNIETINETSEEKPFPNFNLALEIRNAIINHFLLKFIDNIVFITAERIGISIFWRDLLSNRFTASNIPSPTSDFTKYSLVINDSIVQSNSYIIRKDKKNKFTEIADEIETSILKGSLSLSDKNEVFYSNKDVENLSVLSSSSNIKSLSSLSLYLRHNAYENGTLIIDEPEINLHPENQIKIARILAKIANAGIKIFVSTHSDYILREFNNLMMLKKSTNEADSLVEKYGYKQDELLDFKKVGAYNFENGLAQKVEVTEKGFEVDSIDEVISMQNKISSDLRWTLFED